MKPRPLYRGMNLAELDVQYNARATVGDITPFLTQYESLSEKARTRLQVEKNVHYGPHQDEVLDFFPAGKNSPLLVFIHGGYWRLLSKNDSAFMAETFVRSGISVAAINYTLAPNATLDEIVRQVRASMAFLWKQSKSFNFDRSRIFLCGTSAGGHLAAMTMDSAWVKEFHLSQHPVAGACLISGLFDLEPLRLCHPNEWLNLDFEAARRNSPSSLVATTSNCPVIICWAGTDTQEFKRQSRDYAKQLMDAGHSVDIFEVSDRNHFDIVLDLTRSSRELTRKLMELIQR